MSSPFADLDRPPLDPRRLRRDLDRLAWAGPATPWREVRVLRSTGSTNAVVAEAARAGEPEGLVVVAEHQSAGRGRLDRSWVSPPRAGLTLSLLLRPEVPPLARARLPLLLGSAVAAATSLVSGLDVRVKWPNDLVAEDRKLAGLLAEAAGGAVVAGLGLNVSTRRDELPRDDATSLALETGGPVDRHPVLLAVLRAVAEDYAAFVAAGGAADAVLPAYRARCATLGRDVVVTLPGREVPLRGRAVEVDDDGRLVVEPAEGGAPVAVSAGDVVHVRAAQAAD